ncbi:MAG: hypothetical protein AB7T63_00185 [Planctomycetota bacterium]
MKPPPMTGPLRVEEIDGHTWVVGDGLACLCADVAEAQALLADMQRRMSESLRRAISRAFETLAADGWITTIDADRTGAVCRGFDRNPNAPGFAAVVQPISGDQAVLEVGEGLGDEDADLDAAKVVAAALLAAGLDTTTELRDGAAYVTVRKTRGGAA